MANEKRLTSESERESLIRCLKLCHDAQFTPGVYEHSVIGRAALFLEETADAVEVVHGRWLPDMEEFDDDPAVGIRGGVFQTGWKCSICGRSERVKEPYCNCGASMMDGDGNA